MRAIIRGASVFTLTFACVALGGCAGSHAEDPQSALRAYARALEEGRSDDAYRMLSDEARRNVTLAAFRKSVKESPEEARELGRALTRPVAAPVVTAKVTSETGQELELVLENGKWRVDHAAVDLYAQDTPRRAIQGFVRALERKRYDVILRYVPESHKNGLSVEKLKTAWEGPDKDEMQKLLVAIKQSLPNASIEEAGDRATMSYGTGTVQLVKERGSWKVEDFD
ncbi:MAG: hypothetical protein U0174_09830 [Polyangiaceae bacterium]